MDPDAVYNHSPDGHVQKNPLPADRDLKYNNNLNAPVVDRPPRDRERSGQSQAPLKGLPENPAQGRRQQRLQPQQIPPVPQIRNVPPPIQPVLNPSCAPPMPPNQVVSIVEEAMRSALEQHRSQAGEVSDLVTGVTVNLSRKNIQKLPDEVVDVIKNELER